MVVMRNNERNTAAAAEQHVYTHNRGILLETGDVKHPIHIIPRNGYNTLRQLSYVPKMHHTSGPSLDRLCNE